MRTCTRETEKERERVNDECVYVGTRAGVTILRVGQCVMRVEFFRERTWSTNEENRFVFDYIDRFLHIRVALRLIERNCSLKISRIIIETIMHDLFSWIKIETLIVLIFQCILVLSRTAYCISILLTLWQSLIRVHE